jgi:two-component system OmpR family response regulator
MVRQQSVLRSLALGALELSREPRVGRPPRLVQPEPRGYEAEPLPLREPAPNGRILILDPDLADFRAREMILQGHGYGLTQACDVAAARALMARTRFDLLILEIDLPQDDGLGFCRETASAGATRVLIHSRRSQSIDRVAGLEFGAEDYVDKTCHPVEFLARVRALLRRGAPERQPDIGRAHDLIDFDGWQFDAHSGALRAPGGSIGWLSAGDQALLQLFLDRPRELMTRFEIGKALFAGERQLSARVIDVRVVRLRRALEACAPGGGDFIRTIRGGGYLFGATVAGRG